MAYTFDKTLTGISFSEAVARTRAALSAHGLTQPDISAQCENALAEGQPQNPAGASADICRSLKNYKNRELGRVDKVPDPQAD